MAGRSVNHPGHSALWDSPWIDFLFALTAASLFIDIDLPGRVPLFVLFGTMSFLVAMPTWFALPLGASPIALLPLASFLLVHNGFTLRAEHTYALRFVLATASALMFALPMAVRYSRRSIRTFATWFGIMVAIVALYTAIWHISHGFFVSWKRQGDAKAVFNFIPLMLAAFLLSKSDASKRYGAIAFAIGAVLILLSGERKAYILLGIACPLLFNPKSPLAYIAIVGAAALLPLTAALDSSGYVTRQLNTLTGFAQGKVERTISNDLREWQADYIWSLVREKPVLGLGTGGYIENAKRYFHGDERGGLGVHSEVMRILIENGVVGLLLYFGVVLQAVYTVLRPATPVRARSVDERKLAFMFLATCLTYSWLEALDVRTLLATCIIPFIGYLRLAPQPTGAAGPARRWRWQRPAALTT